MVRYGGPRFEFFFTHQFLNNEQMIRKEDAQRVAFILRQREQQKAAEAGRLEKEKKEQEDQKKAEAKKEEEQQQADIPAAPREMSRQAKQQQRLLELSKPRVPPTAGVTNINREISLQLITPGAGGCGRVLFPTSRGVPLPIGRAGACYLPGVDRHRIVPRRPSASLTATVPGAGEAAAMGDEERETREECQYYFHKDRKGIDAGRQRERQERINGIERYHSNRLGKTSGSMVKTDKQEEEEEEEEEEERCNKKMQQEEKKYDEMRKQDIKRVEGGAMYDDASRAPSVFSHASSNEPIKALGTKHMETITGKDEVQEHLRLYGGSMTAPRKGRRPPTPLNDMLLPELTVRLVRMQKKLRT